VDESRFGRPGEPAWSPDSRWLAYSFPGSEHTRCIKVAEAAGGAVHAVTPPQFRDTCPSFDPGGRWLSFLSRRTFDPVYDSLVFDMGFPRGARPYLVTLRAEDPSPFLVRPKPPEDGEEKAPESGGDGSKGDGDHAPPPVRIDWDGIEGRVLAFPVPEGRYDKVAAIRGKVLLLAHPVEGALGGDIFSTAPPATASLDAYDLAGGKHETLVHDISGFEVSAGGEKVVYAAGSGGGGGGGGGRRLRVVAAGKKPDPEVEHEPPGRASGWVDLGRVRIGVEPAAEWAQMVREAWRLQAEQFWVQDMSGVDWDRVLARYLPLVDLVATRAEFSDLMWEMQGELGTSHCYEIGGDYRHPPEWGLARLGADLAWDADTSRWRVSRVAAGASWDQKEASPLASPGVGVGPGTAILAVNGQAVDALTGPGPLLSNQAGQPVELTVEGSGDHQARQVLVPTLSDERPLRYREWVEANRAWVRRATDGRVGYLHVPDMMAPGFAEFHRSFLSEVERDALVVDARFNNGGHVSGLLLEKLARRRIGYDVSRWGPVEPYPQESVGGPIVLVTNEWAGSDGDIFTHGFKLLGLGPVVGTRTWGGVIGIELSLPLVDGSVTTQPEYAFWFVDVGWGVENHGSDPDHEVVLRPQDYAAGRDAQLERAVELVSDALAGHRPPRPDYDSRARLVLPSLPARV
ncbi:MAG: PDZ domain-containing protein, partial [Acidimicrobiales bacterium]